MCECRLKQINSREQSDKEKNIYIVLDQLRTPREENPSKRNSSEGINTSLYSKQESANNIILTSVFEISGKSHTTNIQNLNT